MERSRICDYHVYIYNHRNFDSRVQKEWSTITIAKIQVIILAILLIPLALATDLSTTEGKALKFQFNQTFDFYINGTKEFTGNIYYFNEENGNYNLSMKNGNYSISYIILVSKGIVTCPTDIMGNIFSICRNTNNKKCDPGEVFYIDKDCNNINNFYNEGWFYKLLALFFIIYLLKQNGFSKDIGFMAIIMLVAGMLFFFPSMVEDKPIDLNIQTNISVNDTIPHIDLEKSPVDSFFDNFFNLGNKLIPKNPLIGWLIIIGILTALYVFWEAIVQRGIEWLNGKR